MESLEKLGNQLKAAEEHQKQLIARMLDLKKENLTDSEEYDGAVELRTVDEDQLVLTVRLARTSANSTGWTRLGVVASRQVQAKIGPDVLLSDTNYRLSKALYLLN